jgi:hypothetical protein
MNHILVFIVLFILIAISIIYYYSYNNNIKNHIKENFEDVTKFEYVNNLLTKNTNIRCVLYDSLRNCGYYAGLSDMITKVDFDSYPNKDKIVDIKLNKISNIKSGFIDKKSEYAYFATNTQPAIIIKVNLKDFNANSVVYGILPPTYDNISLSICDSDSKYGYFISTSSFLNTTKYILKVKLDEYQYVTNLDNVVYYKDVYDKPAVTDIPYYDINNNQYITVGLLEPKIPLEPSSIMLDKSEQNLYIVTNLGILKYNITNPNAFVIIPIYSKIFRAGPSTIFNENNPNKLYRTNKIKIKSGVVDNTNQYGFFITNDSKLLKIELSAFIEDQNSFNIENNPLIQTIDLSDITETKNMIIDNDNKYLYGDSKNGKIFKLDINSNSIQNIDVSLRGKELDAGLILDKENKFLYTTNSSNNNYIIQIKVKDYIAAPTEEVQTNESESIINTPPVTGSNITIDEISQIQASINSIVNTNNESREDIKSNLQQINTKMNNVLDKQSTDHTQIKTSIELTNAELQNTLNLINVERAKLNLTPNESYLLKSINTKPETASTPSTPNQEQFANLIQNRVHPRINDFINIQPDWRVEWNKNMHNANINPLLVLP